MPKDSLQQFAAIRDSLTRERETLQSRLTAITAALAGEVPAPLSKSGPVSPSGKSGRTMSAAAKARIAAAARRRWKKAKAAGKNRL